MIRAFLSPPGQPFCRAAVTITLLSDDDHEHEARARFLRSTDFRKRQRHQRISGMGHRFPRHSDPLTPAAKLLSGRDCCGVVRQGPARYEHWMRRFKNPIAVDRFHAETNKIIVSDHFFSCSMAPTSTNMPLKFGGELGEKHCDFIAT